MSDKNSSTIPFFRFIYKLRSTYRWSGLYTTTQENVAEHSFSVAAVANILAVIQNVYYGGSFDPNLACVYALYHDLSESIVTDVIAPVKKFNEDMSGMFNSLELTAVQTILNLLPHDIQQEVEGTINYLNIPTNYKKLVKAADKIDTYIKATIEMHRGNSEFQSAYEILGNEVQILGQQLECVKYFMDRMYPAFTQTVDELVLNFKGEIK